VITLSGYKTTCTAPAGSSNIYAPKEKHPNKIKLTVHIPENIQENVRQQKVNRIYDILNPGISH